MSLGPQPRGGCSSSSGFLGNNPQGTLRNGQWGQDSRAPFPTELLCRGCGGASLPPQHGQDTLEQADPVPRAALGDPRDHTVGAHQQISHICPQQHSPQPFSAAAAPYSPPAHRRPFWLYPKSHGWEHLLAPRTHPDPRPAPPWLREQPFLGPTRAVPPVLSHPCCPTPAPPSAAISHPAVFSLAELSPSPATPPLLSLPPLAPSTLGRAGVPTFEGPTEPSPGPQGSHLLRVWSALASSSSALKRRTAMAARTAPRRTMLSRNPAAMPSRLCCVSRWSQRSPTNQKSLPTGHLHRGVRQCQGNSARHAGLSAGHSPTAGLLVPAVGADAVVLAVATVAQGGAGHVPVRPGHAGEAGRAGEEHSTGVERPRCRDGVQVCHPSLPSVCPPCHQPRGPLHSPGATWRRTGAVPTASPGWAPAEPRAAPRSSSSPGTGSCSAENSAS